MKVRHLILVFVNELLIFFESSASLTVWSFFTFITIGLINFLSVNFSNFIICFWSISLLSFFPLFLGDEWEYVDSFVESV